MNEETIIHRNFSEAMMDKIKLRHDRYQPMGWENMDIKRLLWLLKKEIEEFEQKYDPDETIDIANYAMFLWHKAHVL